MLYQKELKQKYEVDVFVAGGGPAGVSAAIAAARNGKSVFLAESQGSFGGVAAAGLVPAFAPFDDGVNVLAAGIGYELRKQVSDVRGIDTKLLQASLKKIGAYLPNCEV